jgi:hypothetical protein
MAEQPAVIILGGNARADAGRQAGSGKGGEVIDEETYEEEEPAGFATESI